MPEENHLLMKTGLQFYGRMSASISHEIKNVLAIINENAGLLQDIAQMADTHPISPERLERLAEAIGAQIGRADGIIKNMNRFSHGVDSFFGPVELNELLAFVSSLSARLLEMRGCTVETIPGSTPVRVSTSRFLLENLVWRCLDFATSEPLAAKKIHMTVEGTDAGAAIRIAGVIGLDAVPRETFPSKEENALLSTLNAELGMDAEGGELILKLTDNKK